MKMNGENTEWFYLLIGLNIITIVGFAVLYKLFVKRDSKNINSKIDLIDKSLKELEKRIEENSISTNEIEKIRNQIAEINIKLKSNVTSTSAKLIKTENVDWKLLRPDEKLQVVLNFFDNLKNDKETISLFLLGNELVKAKYFSSQDNAVQYLRTLKFDFPHTVNIGESRGIEDEQFFLIKNK